MRAFQQEWERKSAFMKDSILFIGWTLKEVRAASATSTIKEYSKNNVCDIFLFLIFCDVPGFQGF